MEKIENNGGLEKTISTGKYRLMKNFLERLINKDFQSAFFLHFIGKKQYKF